MPITFVEDLAGIQQHRATSDPREVSLDFEAFHHPVLRDNLLQEQPEFRDVPHAVVKVIDFAPLRDLARHFEGQVEGAAGSNDAKNPIEHQEGLADGVHDGLRQQAGVFGTLKGMEGLVAHHDLTFSISFYGTWPGLRSARTGLPGGVLSARPNCSLRAIGRARPTLRMRPKPEPVLAIAARGIDV